MTGKLEKPKPHQMLPRQKVKRKSGAQPGNINALKHGFYSRRFTNLEIKDLKTILPANLEDDIALHRVMSRRMFDFADKKAKTLDEWATVHFAIGSSTARICTLKRIQFLLTGDKGDLKTRMIIDSATKNGRLLGFFN
jgi:hypothetical protein